MQNTPPILVMTFGEANLTASAHPNELKFKGVLVRLDEPSTKAPNGSMGHRIQVPTAVAQRRLSTLIGMGLNYANDLKHHDQRRKVGVITKAWIDGRDVRVEATIWKHDFPEAVRDLKRSGLGMSMEIGDVSVQDDQADVWVLNDFCFLGATVLEKNSAAYSRTHAIAAAKEKTMKVKKLSTKVDAALVGNEVREIAANAAEEAVERGLAPIIDIQTKILTRLDALGITDADDDEDEPVAKKSIAAGFPKKEDDSCDDDEDDDDTEMESEVDKGDETEMGDGDPENTPGSMNKDGHKNYGRKSTVTDKVGPTVSSSRLEAALQREKVLNKKFKIVVAENADLAKRLRKVEKQMVAVGESTGRRTEALPNEVAGLLRKNGIDPREMQASGQKFAVEDVDGMFQNVGGIPPEKRIQLKTEMARLGIMDEGRVTRGRTN